MHTELDSKIIEYWHLSNGACQKNSRYDRQQYVKKWIKELHADLITGMTNKQLWNHIGNVLD